MDVTNLVPDPPIVGNVTHTSVELIWDKSYLTEKKSFTSLASTEYKMKYVVQEEEVSGLVTKGFGTVYGGYARKNIFDRLEPRRTYRYRIKYKLGSDESAWSGSVAVTTTKKPPSSEDLNKAVLQNDKAKVKLLLTELNKELIDAPDKLGYTPLMNAAFKGFTDICLILIRNYADISYENSSGKNALMSACYSGESSCVKLLRQHGASWLCCDKSGSTPLHCAVDSDNVELVKWMLKDGCQVDIQDLTSGWTPLMRLASMNGNVKIARTLIQYGADINALDNDKKSILMMATINSHEELISLLILKGAKIDTKSNHHKTALDFARSLKNIQILHMLEDCNKKQKETMQRKATPGIDIQEKRVPIVT